MLISELIDKLEELMIEHGNLTVSVYKPDGGGGAMIVDINNFDIYYSDKEKTNKVEIVIAP